jgi:hypothetical protein
MAVRLDTVYLYDDPDTPALDVDYLAHWLAERLPQAHVVVRSDYLTHQLSRFTDEQREALVAELCEQLSRAEVDNLVRPADRQRLPAISPDERGLDIVYETTGLQAVLRLLLNPAEARHSHLHLMFTSNYLGAWREGDSILRLRTAVLGTVNILSTSGLVEGLELPRQYHFMRQQLAVMGIEEDVEHAFAEETVGYGDPRLNEVLKGYVMQAVTYRLDGTTGCDDPACRLFLASTHQAVLRTQVLGRPKLCDAHRHRLEECGVQPE